jgi:hypothetical protein
VRLVLKGNEGILAGERVFERYYACYHGTSVDRAKSVITSGQLLHSNDILHTGNLIELPGGHYTDHEWFRVQTDQMGVFGTKHQLVQINSNKVRDLGSDRVTDHTPTKLFFTSPSLQYAMAYSRSTSTGGDTAQVCFEMRQRPDSINVLHSTLEAIVTDQLVAHDEMEWFTDRRYPAIVPVALLVRIQSRDHGE